VTKLAHASVRVSGASGFIGSHLTEALVGNGANVRALDFCNMRNDGVPRVGETLLEGAAVGPMTRPAWTPLQRLAMFRDHPRVQATAESLAPRRTRLPSSPARGCDGV
jgi:nucleoside-diphosphate-sugar epimerase